MQPRANRFVFSQALEGFFLSKEAEGRSPKTLADYRYSLGKLDAWLAAQNMADTPVDELTINDLRRFFVSLRDGNLSPKTIRNIRTAMCSLWAWLERELDVPNIAHRLSAPKANPPAWNLPTQDDIENLLKACDYCDESHTVRRRRFRMKRDMALRDRCIILTLLDTGVRASELCSLTLSDVDLKDGATLVRCGKGRKPRIVYVGKATRQLLWRYIAQHRKGARPDDPLFITREGRALTNDQLSKLVNRIGQRAGVRVWPHLLRHVFATEFLRGGGNLLALRRLLGHASDAMVARYAEVADADLKRAHEAASPVDRWRL